MRVMFIQFSCIKNINIQGKCKFFPAAICEITRKSTNANIYPGAGNYSTGKKVHFSCDSGLMLGERSLTCLDSCEWDSKITYCGIYVYHIICFFLITDSFVSM